MTQQFTIALAGNPNSGKTTIFNRLTGERQHVGNYAGVTVDKVEGECVHGSAQLRIVDLPGTYSLTAFTLEEIVARDFLLNERPDVIVAIVDSSNLERNLFLAVQLKELGIPLVLGFNMSDVARAEGTEFDLETLGELLGAPIAQTVGHTGEGLGEMLDLVVAVAEGKKTGRDVQLTYGHDIENEVKIIVKQIEEAGKTSENYDTRWLAVKLLENDADAQKKLNSPKIEEEVKKSAARIQAMKGDPPEIIIADRRYGFISGACQETVRATVDSRHKMSDAVDSIVTHHLLGLPIFLGLMYLVFFLTFTVGSAPMDWIDGFFGWLGGSITAHWPGSPDSALLSLIVDGAIGGVGGVLIFLPNIVLLFLAIAIIEDSGYMARAAFIMDPLMHKIGLHGRSFIPMLTGFGCSVPAILATRTLESRRDRLTTMLVVPLMSCGARLPIYALIIPAFFSSSWQAPMLWIIYVIGILLAIACAKILRVSMLKGEAALFVMELPPYRMPTLRSVVHHMWERSWLYVRKAGTIILGVSMILWALTTYPKKTTFDSDYEAETAQAQTTYVAAVRALNAPLGLPTNSTLLSDALLAEFEEEAPEAADDEGTKNDVIEQFKTVRSALSEVRENIEAALEEIEVEEDALNQIQISDLDNGLLSKYATTLVLRNEALSKIKDESPKVYNVATDYLDKALGPYEEALAEIAARQQGEELAYSVAGRIGHAVEPLVRPLGFDWKIATAMIGAFAAKEVFVAQMGIVYSVGDVDETSEELRAQLRDNYSPLVGFCVMLFCLIAAPCMATVAMTKAESDSWGWALFQFGGLTVLAYVLTFIVYQCGSRIL